MVSGLSSTSLYTGMLEKPTLQTAQSLAKTETTLSAKDKQTQKELAFQRVMKQLDELQETPAERNQRKAREEKLAQQRHERTRKENQLRGRIAYLRSKLMSNRQDSSAASELSMAQTQLYWVSNAL